MLQIIGLLGCAYLFVKGFELFSMRSGPHPTTARVGGVLAFLFALLFALWFLFGVGSSIPTAAPPSTAQDFSSPALTDEVMAPVIPENELESTTNAIPSDAYLNMN